MLGVARPTSRRRIIVALAIATVALGTVAAPAMAGDGLRSRMVQRINASRAQHGLRPLRLHPALSRDALRHTRVMLRQNRLFHPPNLEQILQRYPLRHLGAAAVGCDASPGRLHRSLMASSVHRDILLHPRLRRVGVGIVRTPGATRCGRGSYWVTELFYG
jgi:uncharacterized protein YkwD